MSINFFCLGALVLGFLGLMFRTDTSSLITSTLQILIGLHATFSRAVDEDLSESSLILLLLLFVFALLFFLYSIVIFVFEVRSTEKSSELTEYRG